MSRSSRTGMNFNTTNNTFRQLMGNGLSYRVPLFQRDYSWGPDEWDDLWQDIVALFEEDAEFRAAFTDKALRTTSSRNRKVARFVLFQVERHASGTSYEFESARYDLEHVLPESPGDDWQQFDDRQREACTYRLGNLTLLTAADNRAAGNAGYRTKRPVYRNSEFGITRKLAEEYDTWTPDKLRSRQAWMARQATTIWRIDF